MSETIYKKYGNYFISKFKNDSRIKHRLIDSNNKERFAADIYTDKGAGYCFIDIQNYDIFVEGIEEDSTYSYQDIESEPEEKIYKFLDEQAKNFQEMAETSMLMLSYQGTKEVGYETFAIKDMAEIHESYNDFDNFDIKSFYDKNNGYEDLIFEEVTRIELQNLYGEKLYEYKVADEDKVLKMARHNNLRRQKDYSLWAYKNSEEHCLMESAIHKELRKRKGIEFYQPNFDIEELYNKVRLREIEKYPKSLVYKFDKISMIKITPYYTANMEDIVFERPNGDMSQKMVLKNPLEESQDE